MKAEGGKTMRARLTLQQIMQTARQNETVTACYSNYLNHTPRLLDTQTVSAFAAECELSHTDAFRILLCAACGLDTAQSREHRMLEKQYVIPGLHPLDPEEFKRNPYYCTVRFPACKRGDWELRMEHYAPYEPFACGHPIITDEFRQIPQVGYFRERFSFPAILENGVEWMTLTPNEIRTMEEPIGAAHGNVLTLGLGLGYFAFMVSEKQEVDSVTVVEKNPDVIALFRELLLPQFPNREKIRIIEADALAYLKHDGKRQGFDFVFADLWHDQSDGLDLYLKLRKMEELLPSAVFSYWIEPTLLATLRQMVITRLSDPLEPLKFPNAPLEEILSDPFLKELSLHIKQIKL